MGRVLCPQRPDNNRDNCICVKPSPVAAAVANDRVSYPRNEPIKHNIDSKQTPCLNLNEPIVILGDTKQGNRPANDRAWWQRNDQSPFTFLPLRFLWSLPRRKYQELVSSPLIFPLEEVLSDNNEASWRQKGEEYAHGAPIRRRPSLPPPLSC